jgi:hypothetical protein
MDRMARLDNGTVIEVLVAPEGTAIKDCFHPDVLASCISCGDDAQVGWVYVDGVLYDLEYPPAPPEPLAEPE